jgi:hypothetical protein
MKVLAEFSVKGVGFQIIRDTEDDIYLRCTVAHPQRYEYKHLQQRQWWILSAEFKEFSGTKLEIEARTEEQNKTLEYAYKQISGADKVPPSPWNLGALTEFVDELTKTHVNAHEQCMHPSKI